MPSFSDLAGFEGFFVRGMETRRRKMAVTPKPPAATPANFALVSQPKPVR